MEEQELVFREMCRYHHAFFERVRAQVGMEGLHPRQGPIMGLILQNDGISQAELVRRLNVSAATVAVSVARLEKLGLLERRRDQHNRRANLLSLTEAGRQQAQKLQSAIAQVQRDALAGFTQAEAQALDAYLERMLRNMGGDTNREGKE